MGLDQRASDALNIFYGNRSFLGTMRGPWIQYGATHAYMYGEALQVFMSALGLVDLTHNPQYGPFPYPVEVAVSHVTPLALRGYRNWGNLLEEWFNIQSFHAVAAKTDDLLIVVDVVSHSSSAAQNRANMLIQNFLTNGGQVLVITRPGEQLPHDVMNVVGRFTGSQNNNLLPFMLTHLDASVATKRPERIFITGDDSERVVTTALSALDHLVRHRGGKNFLNVLANQVFVDGSSSILLQPVHSFEDACTQLGIPMCTQVPANVQIDTERKKVLIKPIG